METVFLHYIELFRPAAYIAIFLGLLLEGELVLFTALLLAHSGYLNVWKLVPTALAGVLIGDYLWYRIGSRLAGTENRFTKLAGKASAVFGASITKRPLRMLLISKFAYGLHRSTLLVFGMKKVPSKTFIRADVLAACLWLAIIGSIAYSLNASLSLAKHYLKYAEVTLLIAVAAWYAFERITAKIIETRKHAQNR